jgi:hypothetical protein
MQINFENMIVTPNEDGTYKLELLNCPFKDNNGEEISGMITFPRVSKDGVDSFKNENVIPKSEIFSVIVPETEYKTMRLKPLNLEFVKEKYCINCQQWCGENHDYKRKNCERCMENIKSSQKAFQNR